MWNNWSDTHRGNRDGAVQLLTPAAGMRPTVAGFPRNVRAKSKQTQVAEKRRQTGRNSRVIDVAQQKMPSRYSRSRISTLRCSG
jgi:hypothetical protein